MPYRSNRELPKTIKDAIPSGKGRTLMREVINSQLSAGKSETVAFASAWAALERAGYSKDESGKWKLDKLEKELKDALKDSYYDDICDDVHKRHGDVEKAEYQGEEVTLNKPFRTPDESKKFAVYVQDGDSVKIVRFGDQDMEIRRDDPDAKRSFRARHKCDEQTDKTTAAYWSCKLWDDKPVSDIVGKRKINDDIFTTDIEAQARSVELGLEGEIHVYEDRDGQATFMPGESHEAYIEQMEFLSNLLTDDEPQEYEEEHDEPDSRIHIEITIKSDGEIIEKQEDQRIVYGWASVIEKDGEQLVDRQGDVIEEQDLIEAVHDFVSESREGKVMHKGGQTSSIVDSIVFTKDLQKAMGIDLNQVGWFVGVKVHDDEIWKQTKSGKFPMFSIGGHAIRETMNG